MKNQKILIIGGSSGMGRAIARLAVERGADVTIAARSESNLKEAAASLGDSVKTQPVDTADETSVRDLFQRLGDLDHLLIPGTALKLGPWREIGVADISFSLFGKLVGPFLCARCAKLRPAGSIVFWSGVLSRRPGNNDALLAAINAAVEAMTRALAKDLAPVRVNCISPGVVAGTAAYDKMPESAREQMFSNIAARLPVGRVGRPEDVASLAIELMTNGFITGAVIDIDGGHLIA